MVYPNTYQPLKGHRGRIPAHLRSYLDFDPLKPETAPTTKITKEEANELIKELTDARSPSPIRRQGSGSYNAHGARGGPNKYREDMKYRKAVKDFVRMLSNASGAGEITPSATNEAGDDDDDSMNEYFLEELDPSSDHHQVSNDHYEPQLAPVVEPTAEEAVALEAEPFVFQAATLQLKKIQIRNLQSKLVYGNKDVYVSIKSGKIYSCQTVTLSNPSNPMKWEYPSGDHRMSFPVTMTSIQNFKLKISVYNKSKGKNRPDILYGTHTALLSKELLQYRFNQEISLSFDLKSSPGEGGEKTGKLNLIVELLEGNMMEMSEPDDESKMDTERGREDRKPGLLTKELERLISPRNEMKEDCTGGSVASHKSCSLKGDEHSDGSGYHTGGKDHTTNSSELIDLDAYLNLGMDNESTNLSRPSLTEEETGHVPLSVENFFDALSSDDGSHVAGSSVIQYEDQDMNGDDKNKTEEGNDDDEYKLYDDFDDEYENEEFTDDKSTTLTTGQATVSQSEEANAPPMKIGRQMTMYESDEDEGPQGEANPAAMDEPSNTEYGGDEFDNDSTSKATDEVKPATTMDEPSNTEYGGDEFDNDSTSKATDEVKPATTMDEPSNTEYGGDEFDNHSNTKVSDAPEENYEEYGDDGFEDDA
jgi:hypothetical protein